MNLILLFLNKKIHNYFSLLTLFSFLYLNYYINKITQNLYYYKRIKFLKKRNSNYNESNIQTIEDKLNWLAIYDVNQLKGKCSDKLLLHEYSKEILGKDICNKVLKIYNQSNQIIFDELPMQFVLKVNHGSSFNIIVENKTNLNEDITKKTLDHWMKFNYGKHGAEFHYSFIN